MASRPRVTKLRAVEFLKQILTAKSEDEASSSDKDESASENEDHMLEMPGKSDVQRISQSVMSDPNVGVWGAGRCQARAHS